MRKLLLFFIPIILATIAFGGFLLFVNVQSGGTGALQVTSIPQSSVYLNGRLIGKTPLCKCDGKNMLPTGEYTVRLVPVDSTRGDEAFEQKITVNKAVLTVVDRTFGKGASAHGSLITLFPSEDTSHAHLSVVSFPQDASVTIDDSTKATTPYQLNSITESDHDILLSKTGYKDKHIRIHAVNGYTLSVIAFLGVDTQALSSPSAQLAQPSTTPGQQKIIINETPTGFLRVHKDASITSLEIAQVKPQEEFVLQDEKGIWYEIKLSDGRLGWVTSEYATKE